MADRYWVGGTGTWNNTNTVHWSNVSGGAGGFSVPTAADNVFFDSASGLSNYTVSTTIGQTLSCLNLTIARATLGTVTFIDTGVFAVAGNLDITGTGVTWSAFGTWTFTSTGARTIKTDGIVLPGITFNGTGGGSFQLLDNLSISLTGTIALTAGTLDLNNFNLRCGAFGSNNNNVRSLIFGTGVVNLTGAGIVWATSSNNNFTMTGSRVINAISTATSGVREIQVGTWAATTSPSVNVTGGTSRIVLTGTFLDLNTTGYTGRIDAGARTIYGNLVLDAGTTSQSSANVTTFSPTSATKTITTNGAVISFAVTVAGSSGTLQLADDFTLVGQTFTVTSGTFDINDKIISVSFWSFVAGTKTIIVGATGRINITGNNATVWTANITGLTLADPANATAYFTYAGGTGTRTLSHSGVAATSFNFIFVNNATDIVTPATTNRTLDFTDFNGRVNNSTKTIYGNFIVGANTTLLAGNLLTTISGTTGTTVITSSGKTHDYPVTISATTGVTTQLTDNLILGVTRTLTWGSGNLDLNNNIITVGLFLASSIVIRTLTLGVDSRINVAGNATTVFTINGNNLTISGTPNVYFTYAGATGIRTITTVSLTDATVCNFIFTGNATDTVALNGATLDLDFSGFNGTVTNTVKLVYGNLTIGSNTTMSAGSSALSMVATSGTKTITSNGRTLDLPLTINTDSAATVRLTDNLTIGNTKILTVNSGIFETNGQTVTTGTFVSDNSNVRTINITNSTIILASTGIVWNLTNQTGATVVSSGSTIELANTTTTARTFAGGNKTYNNLVIGGATGTSILNITGNNTFTGTVSSTKTVGHTIQFVAGSTTTINNWTVNGSSGNLVTITSATAAGHNLVKSGGGTVNVQYTNVRYSNASPANKWYALIVNNNVDLGDNTGWVFVAPPSSSSNFFLLF
jgi:hypothetical protein